MIRLLPEPKHIVDKNEYTDLFNSITLYADKNIDTVVEYARDRFWNYPDMEISKNSDNGYTVRIVASLDGFLETMPELFVEQGYYLDVNKQSATLHYEQKAGLINGLTSLKMLIETKDENYKLPMCTITDYPSLNVRAVAPTFAWYAGYGRIGFDCQLWGFEEWAEYLNICLDNKINQMNMILYGYWPFTLPEYPETEFRNIPIDIWNAENRRWLRMRFTHPNLEKPFLEEFIKLAHKFDVKIFAYVGLNSYNGARTIKQPEKRMIPPAGSGYVNDFDSLCLSDEENVSYIIYSMEQIARLGFDGYTLEESEEGFWFCECDKCKERWHSVSVSPGEAKHKANFWLLNQIYDAVRAINPEAVLGIRAFRQPPLEKDPEFLRECVESMPEDIMLFWAPGLYVPESEFEKWCDAFGKHRIWARDTESNSITSTMGRLYRTFASNLIRYEDEANEQVIEADIRQHRGSVKMGVHGVNGFMFEWYGLFMHLFAHGNYGWGSEMDEEEFYLRACELNFGEFGGMVHYVMKNMLTIHESQIPLYETPFPFQKNKINEGDIPTIVCAKENHHKILSMIEALQDICYTDKKLRPWLPHFDRLHNAQRRNAVIYDLTLAALRYEKEQDPVAKDKILDEILYFNEKDFDIAKEMFFDINPVGETGVLSCMFPYHEIKRIINNIRNPENPDNNVICSGVEAFGWLWL